MSGSARDVQPGYSPKRYLSHLSHTTFDPDSWKKLVETGSLKSFGTTDDGFLPSLLADKYGNPLNHRPAPYKTMSLPPVSPSSSMVGSFTFYNHALSTGAASMVSLPSVNSETIDDQLSAKTVGTFVESLAERLAEVMCMIIKLISTHKCLFMSNIYPYSLHCPSPKYTYTQTCG
jgi:hypothetical protein